MAKNPQIFVEYVAQTAQLSRATKDIEDAGGKTKKTFRGVGAAVASGLAVGAVISFGKSCVSAATDSAKTTAKLEQVFRSMGDTTGKAAKQAENYASALSQKIGVDDDEIMAGQTLLATFGKVSDATARQAGIFQRATAAGADLAAAGFGSITGNAVQLGKALNDPIKGINALARSGVTFTETEKERIKTLVESNKTTEAQRVILAAVEKQVKGTAEAQTTGADKAKVAMGELEESIGGALLPAIQAITPWLTKMINALAPFMPVLAPLALAIGAVVAGIKAWTIAQAALDVVMSANPIFLYIAAIVALIAIIIVLVRHWDTVKAAAAAVWSAIRSAAASVISWFRANWPILLAVIAGPFGLAVAEIVRHWDAIKRVIASAVENVKTKLGDFRDFVVGIGRRIGSIADGIASSFQGVAGAMRNVFASAIAYVRSAVNTLIRAWNSLGFTIPHVHIKLPGPIPDIDFGPWKIEVPQVPQLARGGVVSQPTLAMIGEGAGREIVAPESLLRSIVGEQPIEVRVFLGDQELRGMVRTEIVQSNLGLARRLMTGARA